MSYGEFIKRAWTITWRYRALWVLGLFAGIAGGGGGGGSNYNFNSGRGSGSRSGDFSGLDGAAFTRGFERLLPVLIVVSLGFVVIGIVWWILSIAARGGLIYAVNEIEEGRPGKLGPAWSAGFARFWSVFAVSFVLALPVFLVVMFILLAILVPVLGPVLRGGEPSGWAIAPICGSLAIGIPLLLVLGVVLGLMEQLALRFVMLGGRGAFDAIGESWRAFRTRFKDTILMWLIAWGLNIAAGLVVAIPIVIITLVIVVPAAISAAAGKWAAVAVAAAVAVLVLTLISFAYTAVWGTFTSSLWTLFYRRFTGMAVPAAEQPPVFVPPAPVMPPPPSAFNAPVAIPAPPAPPATPIAPEMPPPPPPVAPPPPEMPPPAPPAPPVAPPPETPA